MSSVNVDTKKLDRLIRKLSKNAHIEVGILEGGAHTDSGKSIAYIGAVHEFGTDKAGRDGNIIIPERSFLRASLEKKGSVIQKFAEKGMEDDLANGDVLKILNRMGNGAVAVIQESFETGGYGEWPDIEQSTKNSKGRSSILIDTGLLRKSIAFVVRGKV